METTAEGTEHMTTQNWRINGFKSPYAQKSVSEIENYRSTTGFEKQSRTSNTPERALQVRVVSNADKDSKFKGDQVMKEQRKR